MIARALAAAWLAVGVAAAGPATATFPSGAEFRLEIADEPEEWMRGYMERPEVRSDEGMLFVYPRAGHRQFWMKNCLVALDMIWLDEELRVVEILQDQKPCPPRGPCPTVGGMRAARYVLEVAAGRAREEGLALGDRIVVVAQPPLP